MTGGPSSRPSSREVNSTHDQDENKRLKNRKTERAWKAARRIEIRMQDQQTEDRNNRGRGIEDSGIVDKTEGCVNVLYTQNKFGFTDPYVSITRE